MKEEELIQLYHDNNVMIKQLQTKNLVILQSLSELSEHKIGEIIMWVENKETNIGTSWRPKYTKEEIVISAVLVEVIPNIKNNHVIYGYKFKLLNDNGNISRLNARPPKNFIWTHNIHKDFKIQ